MPGDLWRPNWKLPAELQARAIALRAKLGYPSLQAWGEAVVTEAIERQEAELAEAERKRRGR